MSVPVQVQKAMWETANKIYILNEADIWWIFGRKTLD